MSVFIPFQPGIGDGSPVNELGEEIERGFVWEDSPMHNRVPEDSLVVYTPGKNVSQLQVMPPDTDTLQLSKTTAVVSIGSVCQDDDTDKARAAWGVYFGPESPYNKSGRLSLRHPQTSSRGEIEALSRALDIVYQMNEEHTELIEVYIMSDSEHLVRGMSEWLETWIEEDGVDEKGERMPHFDAIKEIADYLEDMTEAGFFFKFWHVKKERTKEAVELARKALERKLSEPEASDQLVHTNLVTNL